MGGTFDPIHTGHLLTAEFVRDAYELEKVLFIPAAHSPFKLDKRVASAEDRLAMTELAVAGNPHFEASDIEMCREGVSYTSDTIALLAERFGPEVPLTNGIVDAFEAAGILAFGPVLKVIEPESMAAQIRERLAKQVALMAEE